MQGTQLQSLDQEDSTWLRATKLVHPQLPSLCASTSEANVPRACAPKQREPLRGEGCTQQQRFITIRENPGTQQRPSTATKKIIIIK